MDSWRCFTFSGMVDNRKIDRKVKRGTNNTNSYII